MAIVPVEPSAAARVALRPIHAARLDPDGFWGRRQRRNRIAGIPTGAVRLEEAGNRENLDAAAREARGEGLATASYRGPVFMDSDVYKYLEAVAWELGREEDESLRMLFDDWAAAIADAQDVDGYVNSYVQVTRNGENRYLDLAMGHELYCFGHLIQAAVAAHRGAGDEVLLGVACRAADHLYETFSPGVDERVGGHPVVEMALVELYRVTEDPRYLQLAAHFVAARGHNQLRGHGREPSYFSDRVPARDTEHVEGHAVRALYFAAGVADVVIEGAGDDALADAQRRSFDDLVATRMYLTGGLGARWDGEAFGDAYELPADRAYCETCAAIAGMQWAWRLLLQHGDARYADVIERILFNGFASGVSLSGEEFFYVNPLQVRTGVETDEPREAANGRHPWFDVACCPPNVMRTLASLGAYVATGDDAGIQVHQYVSGTLRAEVAGGAAALEISTAYPFDEQVTVTVTEAPLSPFALSLRVPGWCDGALLAVSSAAGETLEEHTGLAGTYLEITRSWNAGDALRLLLPMPVRRTAPHPRVDALRGTVAFERGPLVYCFEQVDQPAGTVVDDLVVVGGARTVNDEALLDGVVVLEVDGYGRGGEIGEPETFRAIPYYAWANRGAGPMRVFVPER